MAQAVRMLAALAVLAAGATHLWLYAQDGYSSIHAIGPLFLLNVIAAAGIGIGVLLSRSVLVAVARIGYAFATLVAFVVSATSGLFGWQKVWSGTPQGVAGVTELATLALLVPPGSQDRAAPNRSA